jgi:hypothetical protein
MAKELVSDELWKTIEPLLPDEPPKPKVVDLEQTTARHLRALFSC